MLESDDWLRTEEERKQRWESEDARRQYLEDLRDVVARPEGLRVFQSILQDMGAEGYVGCDSLSVHLFNRAQGILQDIYAVDPTTAMIIIKNIRDKQA